ncbi:MAG: 3-oxoacyl-[acyl-carrier protein] reductase, partial [uncultured Blastococcus sp.]
EDDRRAVGRRPRRAPHRTVPDPARGTTGDRRRGPASYEGRRAGSLPQDRQHLLGGGPERQSRAGQLRRREGRHHRTHQDAGQGVGPLQRDREHRGVRVHPHPVDGGLHRRAFDHRRGRSRDQGRGQPSAARRHGTDDSARPGRHPGRGRRCGLPAVHARVRLRQRADPGLQRWPDDL